MSDYDNTNRGVLFKNGKKETEKHPDYTGNINVEGKELRLAAWIKKSKNGNNYMSLSVSEQREGKQSAPSGETFEDDPLPF